LGVRGLRGNRQISQLAVSPAPVFTNEVVNDFCDSLAVR
jgi:hypothetical protein